MTTANDLISSALRLITSITPGEPVDGTEASNALSALNIMLASWSAQDLMVPFRTLESFPLVINQGNYEIGPSASDFITSRPDEITDMFRRDAAGQDYPIYPYTKEQYNGVLNKSVAGLPDRYYYDSQYPNAVIYLTSKPSNPDTLFIESVKPFNQFSALGSSMNLPGEYQHTIKYLLADELADEYGFTIQPGSRLEKKIDMARKFIKRKNVKRKVAGFDLALTRPAKVNHRIVIEG